MKKQWSFFFISALIFISSLAHAVPPSTVLTIDALDPEYKWRLKDLIIQGNTQFSNGQLRIELVTKTRTWYTPWRSLFNKIGGSLFLDFGQVSLHSFDAPIDDLRFAPGFGVSYATPVGPLRLDLGFPLDPPWGDQPWQVHFSIGQFF
jgi:outer membrane protein assembly factor BamA